MTPDLQSTFQKSNNRAVIFQSRHKVMVKIFSYSLIILFILAVAFQVCAILANAKYSKIGAGIWCGILYVATSVMGLLAVRREDKPMTIALLCLAAGSVFTSLALVTLALLSLTSTDQSDQGTYFSLCMTSNAILTVVGFIGCSISIALITISAIASSSHKRVQFQSAPNELEEVKKVSIDVSASQQSTDSSEKDIINSQPKVAEYTGSTNSDDIYESLKSQQGSSVAGSAALDSSTILDEIIEPIYAIPVKKKTMSSSNLSSAGDFEIEVDNRRDSEVKDNKITSTKWFHMEAPEEPLGSDVDDSQYSRNIELPKEDVIVHAPSN